MNVINKIVLGVLVLFSSTYSFNVSAVTIEIARTEPGYSKLKKYPGRYVLPARYRKEFSVQTKVSAKYNYGKINYYGVSYIYPKGAYNSEKWTTFRVRLELWRKLPGKSWLKTYTPPVCDGTANVNNPKPLQVNEWIPCLAPQVAKYTGAQYFAIAYLYGKLSDGTVVEQAVRSLIVTAR